LTTPQSGADDRLRYVRLAWSLDEHEIEGLDAAAIAERLHINLTWLLTGNGEMVDLEEMTGETQVAVHQGPGSENLPGYLLPPCTGPWMLDESGAWRVEREGAER